MSHRHPLLLILGLLLVVGSLRPTPTHAQDDTTPAPLAAGAFEKVVLDSTTTDPIELDIAPDGRVFYIERRGVIKIWHPDTESITLAGYLPVTIEEEDGLMGLAFDPNFTENGWIYLYYAPPEGPPRNQLSRFTVDGDRVDFKSERKMLTVPTQRDECCHTGGSIAFGPDGLLFLSTGDDTNPFASDGFAPIDERPGREPWDAQRTSGNTQDLRGKILRIRPHPDGSYSIPDGNLFADPAEGRPEIYVMGNRNPYRIAIDQETGWLYWGEIGPDAGAPDSARGPAGHDEINQAREAGNYGWPYFVGDNKPYHDYDFAAETSGPAFDAQAPANDSPNNTGARTLPPAQPPIIWYPYGLSDAFPEVGAGGRSAMAGPIYHHDPESVGPHGLPAYFDGSFFFYEWARNWIKEVRFDDNGRPVAMNALFPEMTFRRPMDLELGPDGRLYLIEWGNNFGGGPNSKIVRLDYYGGRERPPSALATATPTSGAVPLAVTFQAEGSHDPNGDALTYEWDVDGDGTTDASGPDARYTFRAGGQYTARLTVTDATGRSATDEVMINAGNTAPTVSVEWPVDGGVIDFGALVRYRVAVSDPEDASVDQTRVVVTPHLGRDSHTLPLASKAGTTGAFRIAHSPHYDPKENIFAALDVRYTDAGTADGPPATGHGVVTLQPRTKQAEFATITRQMPSENLAGRTVLIAEEDSAFAAFGPVNLRNIDAITVRVAPMAEGRIEVRRDAADGPLLASAEVDPADAFASSEEEMASDDGNRKVGAAPDDWTDVTMPVTDPRGPHTLYLVVRGQSNDPLLKMDWLRFDGPGMMMRESPQAEE
jgi:glucose/arabinose dehydrogenase